MDVTVIVPGRDAGDTIAECVRALGAQTYASGAIQILVVDDGSSDATAEIARSAGAEVLSLAPSGPAVARNRGVQEARAELILFTDADCRPDPDWIEKMLEPFSDPEVIATKGIYRSEQGEFTARFVQAEYESRYERMKGRETIDFVDTYAAAFRRDLFEQVGGFDTSFPHPSVEDQEFSFRYARLPGKIIFVPNAVVCHRHADSPRGYFRKKMKIGYWKMRVMARHPDKLVADSHTPQLLKVEMLSVLGLVASLPVAFFLESVWPPLAFLGVFLASSASMTFRAIRADWRLGLLAPFFTFLRSLALGLGTLRGALALCIPERRERVPAAPGEPEVKTVEETEPETANENLPEEEKTHEYV